jgi:hypothetical protein
MRRWARRHHQCARRRAGERSDDPLVTLGLVLDASGFGRRYRMFASHRVEAGPLLGMLKDLAAPPGDLVVLDAGIATEVNFARL